MYEKYLKIKQYIRKRGALRFCFHVIKVVYFKFYQKSFYRANGVFLGPRCYVSGKRYISLGRNFRAREGLRLEAIDSYGRQNFEPEISIGSNVTLNDYVHIGCIENIQIGDNVLIASKVFITDHNHGVYSDRSEVASSNPATSPSERHLISRSVTIGDNVWIGENVSILPGVRLGSGCIVGANSVVTKSFPENTILAGNPAKIIRSFDSKSGAWLEA